MKFTEAQLETAIISLLKEQGYPHVVGASIARNPSDVLIKEDLRVFLAKHYAAEGITTNEIEGIIRQLELLPASDLYDSNKTFCKWLSDGFLLKREDAKKKDIYIQLIDYNDLAQMSRPHHSPHPDPLPEGEGVRKGEGVKEVTAEYRALIKPLSLWERAGVREAITPTTSTKSSIN